MLTQVQSWVLVLVLLPMLVLAQLQVLVLVSEAMVLHQMTRKS